VTNDAALADKGVRQRLIARSVWVTIPGTFAVIGGAYAALPPIAGMGDVGARLSLAARWLVVALLPYVAVCCTIAGARFFEGSHNPVAGGESERLKIHCRVMQNTLEQLAWLAIVVLGLAALLDPAEVRLIPVACVFFAAARMLYWWGYLQPGTIARAPGVQLTFTLNLGLLALALVALARSLVAR
jgi:uncharacterized membrane protein YecN with MAPEG domain